MHFSSRLSNITLNLVLLLALPPVAFAVAPNSPDTKIPALAVGKAKSGTALNTTVTPKQNGFENPQAQVKPEQWRKHPPSVPQPRPFKLPSVSTYKLDNGLIVQLIEDHRFPFITMALGIKAGSALEQTDKTGLADLTADMLNEGTKTKTSKQIADEVDFIGGALRAVSDYDFTIVSGSALSRYTGRLVDVLSDVIFNPTFPDSELTLAKTNLVQELAMKRSEPDFLVEERFNKVIFGDHPYSVVAPTPASVEKISRQDLRQFHDRHFLPNESTLVIVGDFNLAKIKDLIAAKFGDSWKPGEMPVAEMPSMPKQTGRRIYLVDRPESVQSSLKIGSMGIRKTDPGYFAVAVANHILGGAAHSRLFLNIREQKGYTYGAYSSVSTRKQPGAFAAEAEVRTEVTAPALEEFLYELDRIRNVKVSDKELKDAKAYLVGAFQLGLETQSGLAQRLLELKLYDLPDNYLEKYADRVMAVTPDEIRSAARRIIDENNIVIAVVGDAAKIKSELEYFAPVEVYDTSGKLVNSAAGGAVSSSN